MNLRTLAGRYLRFLCAILGEAAPSQTLFEWTVEATRATGIGNVDSVGLLKRR